MFGMDDDEVRQAMRDIFGDDGSGQDGDAPASSAAPAPQAEPDFPEIRSGLLSTVPIGQQVPPDGWRPEDWSDRMGAIMGSSWPGTGGGGAPALHASAQPANAPSILPPPNITPWGGQGPQSAVQIYSDLPAAPGVLATTATQDIPSNQVQSSGGLLGEAADIYHHVADALTDPDFIRRQGQYMQRAGDIVSLGGTGLTVAGTVTAQPELAAPGLVGMGVGSLLNRAGSGAVILSDILAKDRNAAARDAVGAGLGEVLPPTIDSSRPIDKTFRYFGF